MTDHRPPSYGLDEPAPARVYDAALRGKDNMAHDRAVVASAEAAFPGVRTAAAANRAFIHRAVRYLAAEAGIRQFLDIGTGMPHLDGTNVHEIVQSVDSYCQVVYVDNDPVVLAHNRALLVSSPQGVVTTVDGDLREPGRILAEARQYLDFTKPIGLVLAAVVHYVLDDDRPHDLVAALVQALPSGSYLVMSHVTGDKMAPDQADRFQQAGADAGLWFQPRTYQEFARFFTGLDLVDPGIVLTSEWRPDGGMGEQVAPEDAGAYAAVGRLSP
jgi:hypothetical protein